MAVVKAILLDIIVVVRFASRFKLRSRREGKGEQQSETPLRS